MVFSKKVKLKNGVECEIRECTKNDAAEVFEVFNLTHEESDFLLSYPDESTFTLEQEAKFLEAKENSEREAELCAAIDGKIVGTAGIDAVGNKYKVKHRATFGIAIENAFCGVGIGRALSEACIEYAKNAGYTQLELDVVSENTAAVSLYKSLGFVEYGRNPKGFLSRKSGWQELVLMRLEL